MRILITGSSGFVGSETAKLLVENGHTVVHFDLMNGYDIRDINQFERAIYPTTHPEDAYPKRADKVDAILHLAAIARFSDADANPKLAFETNVIGTKNVLEVVKKHHVPLVYASTGSVYMPLGEVPDGGIDETTKACGNSVYGVSKYIGETYVREHTPHIILRYAHLYGKEKRGHGLIGGFVDRINRGLEPQLYGGKQSNDFCYIKDVARANVLALTASWDKWNQVYNIGTGSELTAEEAGRMICIYTGYTGKIERIKAREVDASRFVYDTSKAERMLGFKAHYSFEEGLSDMFTQ